MDPQRLARAVLARYPPDCAPIGTDGLEPLGNAGGLSGARLWRIQSARGPLVLRQWVERPAINDHVARVHGWLAQLRHLDYIAQPIATQAGPTWAEHAGRVFHLEPWMGGRAHPEEPNAPRVSAAFGALARVHAALAARGEVSASPGLASRLDEARRFVATEHDELRRCVDKSPPCRERTLALSCLDLVAGAMNDVVRMLARVPGRIWIQPCLRDCRADHFLFDDGRLSGLVDYAAMERESPAADLARLLGDWIPNDEALRREALTAYEAIHRLNDETRALIPVFERSTMVLGPLRWIRWRFVDQRVFEDPRAVSRALERARARLSGARNGAGHRFESAIRDA